MDKSQRYYIRKITVYAIYILLFSCLQVTFPDKITLLGQVADIMFVFVALVAYYFGFYDGIVVGLIVGMIRDYFAAPAIIGVDGITTSTFGVGMLTLFLCACFSSTCFTRRMHRRFSFALLTVFLATLIYKALGHVVIMVYSFLNPFIEYNLTIDIVILESILPQILLNIIATIPIALMLRFIGPYSKGVNPKLINDDEGRGYSWRTI